MSVKYAVINSSSLGDNTVVAAVSGKKIRVVGYSTAAAGTVTVTWKSGASTSISGPMPMVAAGSGQGVVGSGTYMAEWGVMETGVGQALVLNLSAAVAVGGHLVYREVQV